MFSALEHVYMMRALYNFGITIIKVYTVTKNFDSLYVVKVGGHRLVNTPQTYEPKSLVRSAAAVDYKLFC